MDSVDEFVFRVMHAVTWNTNTEKYNRKKPNKEIKCTLAKVVLVFWKCLKKETKIKHEPSLTDPQTLLCVLRSASSHNNTQPQQPLVTVTAYSAIRNFFQSIRGRMQEVNNISTRLEETLRSGVAKMNFRITPMFALENLGTNNHNQ